MQTARDVIEGAYEHISIFDPDASELSKGLTGLNDMLASWEPKCKLGFSPLANVSDTLRVPRYAIGAIKAHLAILLASSKGKAVPDSLAVQARKLKDDWPAKPLKVQYPSILPMGSGNISSDYVYNDPDFFPENTPSNF